jgi:hypothetical protein
MEVIIRIEIPGQEENQVFQLMRKMELPAPACAVGVVLKNTSRPNLTVRLITVDEFSVMTLWCDVTLPTGVTGYTKEELCSQFYHWTVDRVVFRTDGVKEITPVTA